MFPGIGKNQNDNQSPDDPLTILADIRAKLDALEQAIGGEEQEPTETTTGAEMPTPAPTDEEVMAGIPSKRKPGLGMFGG